MAPRMSGESRATDQLTVVKKHRPKIRARKYGSGRLGQRDRATSQTAHAVSRPLRARMGQGVMFQWKK